MRGEYSGGGPMRAHLEEGDLHRGHQGQEVSQVEDTAQLAAQLHVGHARRDLHDGDG